MKLNINVCLKIIPDPSVGELRMNTETGTLVRTDVANTINPVDKLALEAALRIKDLHPVTRIKTFTMGPPETKNALRIALAMGADEAYLLSDKTFAGADTMATSFTLSKAIEKAGPCDMLICGSQTSDSGTSSVGPSIGEWLRMPIISFVTHIDFDNETLFVTRSNSGLSCKFQAKMPLAITIDLEFSQPRQVSFSQMAAALRKTIHVWNANDLAIDSSLTGSLGSPTVLDGFFDPQRTTENCQFFDGDPGKYLDTILDKLKPFVNR